MSTLSWYLRHRPAWMAQGACIDGVDPEIFFPKTEGDKRIPKAKAICDDCPVAADCLTYALDTFQQGIWGGTTDEERRDIRADLRSTQPHL